MSDHNPASEAGDEAIGPGPFLRLILPDTGHYCLARPFKPGEQPRIHEVFPTISEMVTRCFELQHTSDVYFACLSLREAEILGPDTDPNTGKLKRRTRIKTNMLAAKSVFWDLDVGNDAGKYSTRQEMFLALANFLDKSKLPLPMILTSGGGAHVYWPFVETIPVEDWVVIAWHLRQLGEAMGVKLDPSRTYDCASILRVPQTFNWKDPANPREVKRIEKGAGPIPVDSFRALLADAMIRAGVTPTDPPNGALGRAPTTDGGLGEQTFNDFGPPPTLDDVAEVCGQMRQVLKTLGSANPDLDNNTWYSLVGLLRHVEDGENWARKLTALSPRDNSDIEAKLQQQATYAPPRCSTLRDKMAWGEKPCEGCRFRNNPTTPNPIAAARIGVQAPPPAAAPAPTITPLVAPGLGIQSMLIPNPPHPFERTKAGNIAINRKDKDGNETLQVIYENDLYPLKRLVNREDGTEQQLWRVILPRTGAHEFLIESDALYDGRKFCVALSNNGIYPHKADVSALQDYMTAYISQLQKDLDGEEQSPHLGWSDDFKAFILPDKTLLSDGTVRATALTKGAERMTQFIRKRGTLQKQVELMRFFRDPAYVANQLVILGGLGSIIFHATGHHGIVVNCSGDPGASKSTTLAASAASWGDPVLWPINGTNSGATPKARAQAVVVNANLPTHVDEVTHIPPKDLQDLVMNITQPGHRLRLQQDGTLRKQSESYKSAIMICTANTSLHTLLSYDNAAGTAGSMRVFEMRFATPRVHTKEEADEFLRQIKENFGWIGEQVASFCIQHMDMVAKRVQWWVREIDRRANIATSERFWSAYIAVCLTVGEIANALHLLDFDLDYILEWAITKQIPYMRGIVKEEYRDPLMILSDYIMEKQGGIIVIDQSTQIGANTGGKSAAADTAYALNKPNGSLLGHFDIKTGMLYLLKQGFKEYCSRIGASSSRIIEELGTPRAVGIEAPARIIVNRSIRKTLGAGTEYAKGQSWCFAVDLRHPEMSGSVPLVTVEGGQATTPPTGQLTVVK